MNVVEALEKVRELSTRWADEADRMQTAADGIMPRRGETLLDCAGELDEILKEAGDAISKGGFTEELGLRWPNGKCSLLHPRDVSRWRKAPGFEVMVRQVGPYKPADEKAIAKFS